MLRSLYKFEATFPKTLGFQADEHFILYHADTKHKNWWEVINSNAHMGFVPNNYVERVTVSTSYYIDFIDTCIERLRKREVPSEFIIGDRKEAIAYLKNLKRQVDSVPNISQDSVGANGDTEPPLLFRNVDGQLETIKMTKSSGSLESGKKSESEEETTRKRSHDNLPEESDTERKPSESNVSHSSKVLPAITYQSVFELVENVRVNTKLSHEMSKVAVVTVVQGLHELLPASVFPYLSTILKHAQTNLVVDDVQIDQTHDASRLKIIFNELTSCKEDSQQRSWMLHEDEAVIKEYIIELISILVRLIFLLFYVISSVFYITLQSVSACLEFKQMKIHHRKKNASFYFT